MWHKVAASSGGDDSPGERYYMALSSVQFFRKNVQGLELADRSALPHSQRVEDLHSTGNVRTESGRAVVLARHTGRVAPMSRSWRILMVLFVAARKGAYWRALHLAQHLSPARPSCHTDGNVAQAPHPVPGFRRTMRHHRRNARPSLGAASLRLGSGRGCAADPRLRGHSFDLIHLFDCRPTALIPALFLKSKRHIPLVMDWEDWLGRGGSVEERPNRLIRTILRPVETFFEDGFRTRADATTVICSTLWEKAVALGVAPESILLLRDGADLDRIQPLDSDACRSDLGLSTDSQFIGYVGSIFYRDAQLMAAAFNCIHERLPSGAAAVDWLCDISHRRNGVFSRGSDPYRRDQPCHHESVFGGVRSLLASVSRQSAQTVAAGQ